VSEGETPMTDGAAEKAAHNIMLHHARRGHGLLNQYQVEDYIKDEFRDLERKLAERERDFHQAEESRVTNAALYEGALKRLESSERARRSLSDATDHLNARLREEQAKLAEARTALEKAKELICHVEVHANYKRYGRQQMTTEQRALWDAIWPERVEAQDKEEAIARIDAGKQ
jgi:chromosome segregation ATPase